MSPSPIGLTAPQWVEEIGTAQPCLEVNHSPVAVYLKNLCLVMQDGHQIFAPRDAVTGSRFLGSEIQPSRRYGFFYSPEDPREPLENSPIICAAAKDEIGREYRSDEEEMRKVLLQLSPPSKTLSDGFISSQLNRGVRQILQRL